MQLSASLRAFGRPPQIAELRRGGAEEVVDYLARDPAANLFMLSWLENYGVRAPSRPELFGFRVAHEGQRLVGVSLIITGRLSMVEADGGASCRAFARHCRTDRFTLDHIVSRRQCVVPYWSEYAKLADAEARLLRDQELHVVDRSDWMRSNADVRVEKVRLAQPRDIDSIFWASAKMHAEETLEDPLVRNAEHFRRHVEHRVENGRTFAWFDEHRRLLFKADVSAQSSWGAQISGVYTPAALRGQGIATQAMREICASLFERGYPRVTLYVNRTNAAALRVYSKVGFRYHTDYQTVFIQAPG